MASFRARMCFLQVPLMTFSFRGQIPPLKQKPPKGVNKQFPDKSQKPLNFDIIKTTELIRIISCTSMKTTKDTSWVILLMRTTNPRWRTAAVLEIEYSQYLSHRSSDRDEIFQEYADCGYKPCEDWKFAYISRIQDADDRDIGNRWLAIYPKPFNRSDENLHKHADCDCKHYNMPLLDIQGNGQPPYWKSIIH